MAKYAAHAGLFAAVVAVQIVTMPASNARGDPRAVRQASAHWVRYGEFGIPYAHRGEMLPSLNKRRGQFFFENDDKQYFYSKYRLINSVLFVPPMLIEQWRTSDDIPIAIDRHHSLVVTNLWMALIAGMVAVYLALLAGRFSRRRDIAVGVALASIYTSLGWNYLRAQQAEAFQILFFSGFAAHLGLWWKQREGPTARWHFLAAMLHGFLLTQSKPYMGLVFPAAYLATVVASGRPLILRQAAMGAVRFGAFGALSAAAVLIENHVCFGSATDMGYSQWAPTTEGHSFRLAHFAGRLLDYTVGGTRSIVLYCPLVIVAFASMRRAFDRDRLTAALLCLGVGSIGAALCLAPTTGGWSYGPRYFAFGLPALSIVAAVGVDWMLERRKDVSGGLAIGVTGIVLICSLWLTFTVNRVGFQAHFAARNLFERFHASPEALRYFDDRPIGLVTHDLIALSRHGRPFAGLQTAQRVDPERSRDWARLSRVIRSRYDLHSNLYFFPAAGGVTPPPPGARPPGQ